ncbi:MAG: thiamine-phosphate kinase, partial [Chloroflexota bacterium]|nr:thiamine-phosphate kinase [Chloroflexota bacterium]
ALVITTDSLVEDIHFRFAWTDWASLGHKALAVNLSDLAAMGARPRLALVTLGLRGNEAVADVVALYQGLGELAERTGTLVAGGDIVRSPEALLIHMTVIGDVPAGPALSRSGAREGDIIAVSGTLGASAAGLHLLEQGRSETDSSSMTGPMLIGAHLRPEPRLMLGQRLLQESATAAMDLSDGLFGDLPKLLSASGVAAEVDAAEIPVAASVRALFPDDWLELATRGGEDYELVFTAPPAVFDRIQAEADTMGATVTAIGRVRGHRPGSPRLLVLNPNGEAIDSSVGAFDHFR